MSSGSVQSNQREIFPCTPGVFVGVGSGVKVAAYVGDGEGVEVHVFVAVGSESPVLQDTSKTIRQVKPRTLLRIPLSSSGISYITLSVFPDLGIPKTDTTPQIMESTTSMHPIAVHNLDRVYSISGGNIVVS